MSIQRIGGGAKQPLDTDLTAIAALTSAADKLPYATGAGTWALTDLSAFARTILDDANAAAVRATIGAGSSSVSLPIAESDVTNLTTDLAAKQPLDTELTALAGLASAADKLPYFTGSGTAALAALSSFIRTLLDDADAATARATLGVTAAIATAVPLTGAGEIVYGAPGTLGTNVALISLGATATAISVFSTDTASKAIDASDSTNWSGDSSSSGDVPGDWIYIDLQTATEIAGWRLYQHDVFQRAATYKVQHSPDASTWVDIVTRTVLADDETVSFTSPVTDRYFRFLAVTGDTFGGSWKIRTIELYPVGTAVGTPTPLSPGSAGDVMSLSGGVPVWTAPTPLISAASDTVAGKVELATTAETTTGTDATRAVTPKSLHDMTSLSGAAWFLDEDNMASDSATKTASQQSIKAYADTKQTLDSDLTTIAGLTATTDNVIQSVASAWASRTPAQLKATLALAKADVGLGSVDNTSDAGKPVSTAQQAALDLKQDLDSDLTAIAGISPTNDDVIQRKSGAWTNRSMAQIKTDLVLVKADVGLGSVDNTSDASKPISTATQTALDAKQPLDSDLTTIAGLTATTDNFMVAASSAWASRTPAQAKTSLALVKGDVGLGNVDNTSDAAKPVSTATQTALDAKQPLDSDLTTIAGLTATTDNFLVSVSSAWASRTPAQVKTTLALNNVDNTADTAKPVSTAQQTALDLKATAGAALTEAAEANSTPVAGATSTALGSGIRVFAFFTLPSTEKWYVITGIEWLNKATVNGNVWCGVEIVDASPPVLAGTVNVATGARIAQAGSNAAQRNSQIASQPIRGGAILGVWFVSDSATGTFGNTAVGSANNRKTLAAGTPALADVTAWTASTAGYYVKAYYRGIK